MLSNTPTTAVIYDFLVLTFSTAFISSNNFVWFFRNANDVNGLSLLRILSLTKYKLAVPSLYFSFRVTLRASMYGDMVLVFFGLAIVYILAKDNIFIKYLQLFRH